MYTAIYVCKYVRGVGWEWGGQVPGGGGGGRCKTPSAENDAGHCAAAEAVLVCRASIVLHTHGWVGGCTAAIAPAYSRNARVAV